MNGPMLCLLLALGILAPPAAAPALAQMPHDRVDPAEALNTGQDPTRPLTRLDLRAGYEDLDQDEVGGHSSETLTLRADRPVPVRGGWTLALRGDVPVEWTKVPSRDNPQGHLQFGFSDSLVQALLIAPSRGHWTYALGTRVVLPTGQEDEFGPGKYQLVPTVALKYDLGDWMPDAWIALVLRQAFDVAGRSNGGDVALSLVQPILNLDLPRDCFLNFSPEARYDWNSNEWHVPFAVEVGRLLNNRKVVVSLELKTALINDLPVFEKSVELRIGFFF